MFILRNGHNYYEIPLNVNRFPDGALAIGDISNNYNEILWLYDGDEELFTLMCLREHAIGKEVKLIMPYVPHARMDRTKNREVFTLKTFCKAINNMNFNEVVIADPHSNVCIALLDRVEVITPGYYIEIVIDELADQGKIFDNNFVLFFPDEGAMKRYSKMFPNIPYAFGMKDRDWKTGKINGFSIINSELIKDKTVLIVDDICSRGGTFYHASKALNAAGASSIYLYITHCEDTIFDGDMYKGDLIEKIYTTDSKLSNMEDDKVEVIYSFAEDFKSGNVL